VIGDLRPAIGPEPSATLSRLADEKYPWKDIPGSSHEILRRRILALPPGRRLLEIGAAGGHLGRAVRERCARLAGVDPAPATAEARRGYDEWRTTGALESGDWNEPFDVAVCADVLEHFADPSRLLRRLRSWLVPGGLLLASIPNVANVTMRLSLGAGRFDYTERGILDRTHLRFFTRRTARALLEESGFRVREVEATAMPIELAVPLAGRPPLRGVVRSGALAAARVWPTMFGYQFVFEAVSDAGR
jgi:2-polyprenyl-3-methyl-5-hydroxy-6-metoxy-1,4-benzoquinol methylase